MNPDPKHWVEPQNQHTILINNEKKYEYGTSSSHKNNIKTVSKACLKTVRTAQFWTEEHPGLCRGTAWTWLVAATGLVNNTVFVARLDNLKRMSPRDTDLIL
jgi:hypothetical protein